MSNSTSVKERLSPKSTLVCNLALRECGEEVLNNPTSLMNHFIKHGWKQIPFHVIELIKNGKPYERRQIRGIEKITKKSYLELIKKHPEFWWFDNGFSWVDIRNLHFLHKRSDGTRSLRMYYHE